VARKDVREDTETRLVVSTHREIRYSVIHSAKHIFDRRESALRDAVGKRPVFAVIDEQIKEIYGDGLRAYMEGELDLRGSLTMDAAENKKTWVSLQRVCEKAINIDFPRDGVIVGVGGGVILDIAGFAASIFRRGVSYVRIPTSLTGLIDVGVGIKHGINVGNRKSIVGSFYPATVNINDATFLATLPRRHISCGFAEIIKIAVVRDADLFATLETYVKELIVERFQRSPIARAVLIRSEFLMMQELEPNLFESDLRRLPDFGHTFSPAIEAASGWSIRHGEAVALDMLISTALARCKGLCSEAAFVRLRQLISAAELPITHEVCRPDILLKGLHGARKHRAGNLNLVVPTEIGRADFIQEVSLNEIKQALALCVGGKLTNGGAVSRSWRDLSPAWNIT
jgi:3-dehydroquinate synthase